LQFLGHDIIICPVVVQNDPKLWPDANKFNPSRFCEREAASAKASSVADPNDLYQGLTFFLLDTEDTVVLAMFLPDE